MQWRITARSAFFVALSLACAVALPVPASADDLVSNPGYESGFTEWGGAVISGSYGNELAYDYEYDANTGDDAALQWATSNAASSGDLVQDIKLEPCKMYRISVWVKTTGSSFDGPVLTDQWVKVGYELGATQDELTNHAHDKLNWFACVDTQTGWTQYTAVIATSNSQCWVRLSSYANFAANADYTGNRVQIDDWWVEEYHGNLIANSDFSTGDFTGYNGAVTSGSYANYVPTTWGAPISTNFVTPKWSAVAYASDSSASEGTIFQDILVTPGKTYKLSLWVYAIGPNFDGSGGADHWTKPFCAVASSIGNLAYATESPWTTIQTESDWICTWTTVTVPAGNYALRLGLRSRFAAGSTIYQTGYPRVQTDDWYVEEYQPNLLTNPGFDTGDFTGYNGTVFSGNYGNYVPTGWGTPIGDNYTSASWAAVAYAGDNGACEGNVYQDLAVTPGRTYRVSMNIYTKGPSFDGAGGSDHWTKPFHAIATTSGGLSSATPTYFTTIESETDATPYDDHLAGDWAKCASVVHIPPDWGSAYLRLGLRSKFVANSTVYQSGYPRVQTDDWSVEVIPDKKMTFKTATWFPGSSNEHFFDVNRWRQDVSSMKKYGLDGVWNVNVLWSLMNYDTESWEEGNVAALKEMVAWATSQDMHVNFGAAYYAPLGNFMVNETQWGHYYNYISRIAKEFGGNPNVTFILCEELIVSHQGPGEQPRDLWTYGRYYSEVTQHFHDWCYNQNSSISYWNNRWGTNYTWETIVPANDIGTDPPTPITAKKQDHLRWIWAMQQPRMAQLASVFKQYAPYSLLGYHYYYSGTGWITTPAYSPLALTNQFDFVSYPSYWDLTALQDRLAILSDLHPSVPRYVGELGNYTGQSIQTMTDCKDWLESQGLGYNWWDWQACHAESWFGFLNLYGNRRDAFSLLPYSSSYGTITGRVTTNGGATALNGASVYAAGGYGSCRVVTHSLNYYYNDVSGLYRADLPPGYYTVTFQYPGKTTQTVTNVPVYAGYDTEQNVNVP